MKPRTLCAAAIVLVAPISVCAVAADREQPGDVRDAIIGLEEIGGTVFNFKGSKNVEVIFDHSGDRKARKLRDTDCHLFLPLRNNAGPLDIRLVETALTDAGLATLARLPNIRKLTIDSANISDAGVAKLKALRNIEILELRRMPIKGHGLKALAGWKKLRRLDLAYTQLCDRTARLLPLFPSVEELDISHTKVTDLGLRALKPLKRLKSLSVRFTRITGTGLRELSALPRLANLNLGRTRIRGRGYRELAKCRELRVLILRSARISPAGLKELKHVKELENLNLVDAGITDAHLAAVGECTQIFQLQLHRNPVTDAGLRKLHRLRLLHEIWLDNTKVTRPGLRAFEKAHPFVVAHGVAHLKPQRVRIPPPPPLLRRPVVFGAPGIRPIPPAAIAVIAEFVTVYDREARPSNRPFPWGPVPVIKLVDPQILFPRGSGRTFHRYPFGPYIFGPHVELVPWVELPGLQEGQMSLRRGGLRTPSNGPYIP